jgi:hypothetical protein
MVEIMLFNINGGNQMKNKIIIIIICTLLLLPVFSFSTIAGDPENPEVEDRIRDVLLFGLFPFLPQFNFKYVDIISAWIFEESDNPEYLYMNIKIRDLQDATEKYDAIYVISWAYNSATYSASVHISPEGATSLIAGPTDEEGNDYINFVVCEGDIDSINDIISWKIPKDTIGSPSIGNKITNIVPHTHLRYPESSGIPMVDLFKDLPWNAKITKDYQIEY